MFVYKCMTSTCFLTWYSRWKGPNWLNWRHPDSGILKNPEMLSEVETLSLIRSITITCKHFHFEVTCTVLELTNHTSYILVMENLYICNPGTHVED